MENRKQYLIDKEAENIKRLDKEIEESDGKLGKYGLDLKVDKVFYKTEDLDENIRENIKYGIDALESMVAMEQNKNEELKKDLQISKMRMQVIKKFEEEEL